MMLLLLYFAALIINKPGAVKMIRLMMVNRIKEDGPSGAFTKRCSHK